jgi:hypothetical protein
LIQVKAGARIVGRPGYEGTKSGIAANKVATHAQTKMKAHWSRVIQAQ